MTIQRIHDRLVAGRTAAQDDTGLSMTEVITALFVFTIFILGLGYSLLSMTRLVGDDENRQVAAALASQEIDRVRAIPDAFDVLSSVTVQQVGNVNFTITRTAGWVTTSGSTASCGSGGGNLQDKAVDVEVTWQKQYVKTSPVRSTTILAPSTRINDPNFSTIIVSALGADGKGRGGVPVTVINKATGVPITGVDATDSSGCSYVLKVTPGTYTVSLTKANWISSKLSTAPISQLVTPSQDVPVLAGGSGQANFQFDAQATFAVTYGPMVSGNTPKLPTALSVTFLNSSGVQKTTSAASSTQLLFPYGEGYAAVAGDYTTTPTPSATAGCQSIDPIWWNAGTVNGTPLAAGTRPQTGVAPGGTGSLVVPMGVVAVKWPALNLSTSIQLRSAAAPAGLGDPGCFTAPSYTYNFATPPAGGSTSYLAVPFGSYQAGSLIAGVFTLLPVTGPTVVNATGGEVTGNVITLDPRNPS